MGSDPRPDPGSVTRDGAAGRQTTGSFRICLSSHAVVVTTADLTSGERSWWRQYSAAAKSTLAALMSSCSACFQASYCAAIWVPSQPPAAWIAFLACRLRPRTRALRGRQLQGRAVPISTGQHWLGTRRPTSKRLGHCRFPTRPGARRPMRLRTRPSPRTTPGVAPPLIRLLCRAQSKAGASKAPNATPTSPIAASIVTP